LVTDEGNTSGVSDGDLYQRILMFTGTNSRYGQRPLSREDYLRNMRKVFGMVSFKQVIEVLTQIQREGLAIMEFTGPVDFKVILTPFGGEVVKRVERGESLESALAPAEPSPVPEFPPTPPEPAAEVPEVAPAEDLPMAQEEPALPEAPEVVEGVVPDPTDAPVEEEGTVDKAEDEPVASGEETEPDTQTDADTQEDEEAGPPASHEPITNLITSMQAHMAKTKGKTLPRPPPDRPTTQERAAEEPSSAREMPDFRQARENLEKRERALRERTKTLSQREVELIQREEAFDETRMLLESELMGAKEEAERLSADVKERLPKLEREEARLKEREAVLEAKIAALEEREDQILSHSKTLTALEDSAEALDEQRINLRDQIRDAHVHLVEHVKKNRKAK